MTTPMHFSFAAEAEGFDTHISNSIRGYKNLLGDVLTLGSYCVQSDTTVMDLGCTTGKFLQLLARCYDDHTNRVDYVGVDIEPYFKDEWDARDTENEAEGLFDVEYEVGNIYSESFDWIRRKPSSLITSIFTLQFLPQSERLNVLTNIYDALCDGGAFIFSEKCMHTDAHIQEMMTFNYYDFKRKTYSCDEILDKEQKLRYMMRLNTVPELYEMVYEAGFVTVDQFWQNHSFRGFIALK